MISYIERTYFNDLLNRGGYVLDFSTYRFDEFTLHSVGIALCETYNLSKGKSLNEFINEGDRATFIEFSGKQTEQEIKEEIGLVEQKLKKEAYQNFYELVQGNKIEVEIHLL